MWREVHVHSLRILVHRLKSELSQHVSTVDSGKKIFSLKWLCQKRSQKTYWIYG